MRESRSSLPTSTLLVATTSAGKLRELVEILAGLPIQLVTLRDVGITMDVEETGTTLAENAHIKARAYGEASGLLTLAEDSGLMVAELGGAPGVYSARWEGSDYTHKNARLLELLDGKAGAERACAYRCVMVLRHTDGRTWQTRGELRGQIGLEARGTDGFGYDPIFLVPRLKRTLAEIPIHEKDRISHRGRAGLRMRPLILRAIEGEV